MNGTAGSLKIVVTSLTRMSDNRICVAGMTNTGEHIRPLLDSGRLSRSDLRANGGVFDIGAVVNLGPVENVSVRPEVEDRLYTDRHACFENYLEPETYWGHLKKHAKRNLRAIFGTILRPVGTTMTVPVGLGQASLGLIRVQSGVELFLNERGRIRAAIAVASRRVRLPVTDIRLYDGDTPREELMHWIEVQGAGELIVSVGLGRPFKAASRPSEEHWLQINNIHPGLDPLWQQAPGPLLVPYNAPREIRPGIGSGWRGK